MIGWVVVFCWFIPMFIALALNFIMEIGSKKGGYR